MRRSYNPDDPSWLNRDRFILSAGHGSMFLYSWLHMSGYDLPMEEVQNFRVKDSKTPGHPEFGWTPGVESTTGPLGQGVGNGVGMAAAAKLAAATLNTAEHTIIDHHVVVLCGDGCLQEGVANEAVAFAGHEKLDNLILMYDSNGVTLDKMAEHTQSEDVQMRFEAQGWEVLTVDGHDMDALTKAYRYAKESDNGKPTLIVCKTIIGKGIDEIAGTCAAHGEAGVKYVDSAASRSASPSRGTCRRRRTTSSPSTRPSYRQVRRVADDLQGVEGGQPRQGQDAAGRPRRHHPRPRRDDARVHQPASRSPRVTPAPR